MGGTLRRGLGACALTVATVVIVTFTVRASPLVKSDSPSDSIASRISLFQRVLIYAKEGSSKLIDGRWNLSQAESKLSVRLSAEETKQLMACTGQIVCQTPAVHNEDEDRVGRKVSATAVSVLKPDLLVTAKHVLFKGKRAVVPFGSCSFRSYSHRKVAIPVLVDSDQRKGYVFNNEDFVVLRLKRELQDCSPLAIGPSDSSLREGEQIFSVTGHQVRSLNRLSRREPVLAKGTIKKFFDGVLGGPSFYYTDLDFDVGGSGGAVFTLRDGRPVSDDGGRLILKGLSVAYGPRAKNGKPYSEERNYTIIVGLQAEFRDLVKGKAHQPPVLEPAPCVCSQDETAKINVVSESIPPTQSDSLAPWLQHQACSRETTPDGRAEKANANCTELERELKALAKSLKPAASLRSKQKYEFTLSNETRCPICFTYSRCNNYGCWDEVARLSGKSTLFAGVGERAPLIKNPQFCKSIDMQPPLPPRKPALAHIKSPVTSAQSSPPFPPRKPEQTFPSAPVACEYAIEPEVKFIAAKEKAMRAGVHALTSDDIRGLTLQQIRELRGY